MFGCVGGLIGLAVTAALAGLLLSYGLNIEFF
jgi:hypothetical protein